MTAPITEDQGPVPAPEPDLSTPEGRWSYVLTLWHIHSLPTPEMVQVADDITIWIPANERGQADRWAAAMQLPTPQVRGEKLTDGSPNPRAIYSCLGYRDHDGVSRYVLAHLNLTADAEVHGGPIVRTELAAAESVVAMLGGAR